MPMLNHPTGIGTSNCRPQGWLSGRFASRREYSP